MARGSAYNGGWPPYVPVAERRKQAARLVEKLRKKGQAVSPVHIEGRRIAETFWGKAWCDNLESYRDYENRLERGRTYVRNGSVIDLQVAEREVTALVSGSSVYTVKVGIAAVPAPQWRTLCRDCAGGIDSLVELLQGRFSRGVMERLCRLGTGLFPRPADIRFSCSCPDAASLCKHVAATLYGVGSRLDQQPELLFRLRAVNQADLVGSLDTAVPLAKTAPAADRVLAGDDVAALFGLDMAEAEVGAPAAAPAAKPVAKPAEKPIVRAGAKSTAKRKAARSAAPKPAAVEPAASKPVIELTPDGFVKWWK